DLRGRGRFIHVIAPVLAGVAGSVHVGMDEGQITSVIWSAITSMQLLLLAIFLLSVAVASVLVRRVAEPLTMLGAYARRLAAGGGGGAAGPRVPRPPGGGGGGGGSLPHRGAGARRLGRGAKAPHGGEGGEGGRAKVRARDPEDHPAEDVPAVSGSRRARHPRA